MALDTTLLRKKVERLEGLPTLPSVAGHLVSLTRSPRTSATEVGDLISQDQALTARVLKLVNSAFYGFPKAITTVNHAVVILGFSRVKNIVLAASAFGLSRGGGASRLDLPRHWEHSLGAAVAARVTARTLHQGDPEDAFVCGLLHDIGKLVLAQLLPKEFDACVARAAADGSLLYDAEKEVLGLAHPEVGRWLAERWKLPANIQAAIRYHHTPGATRKDREMVAAVHVGDILARALLVGSGGDDSIPNMDLGVFQEMDLSKGRLDRLLGETLAEIDRAADFFELIEG